MFNGGEKKLFHTLLRPPYAKILDPPLQGGASPATSLANNGDLDSLPQLLITIAIEDNKGDFQG